METVTNRESVYQDNMLSAAKFILCCCHSKVKSFVKKSGPYSINISELEVETMAFEMVYCNILHMAMSHGLQPHTVTKKKVHLEVQQFVTGLVHLKG